MQLGRQFEVDAQTMRRTITRQRVSIRPDGRPRRPWLGHNSTFEPQLVKKRQRRLSDMDLILSLFVKGLTTGEIAAHFAEVHGTSVSKDTIS